MLVTSMGIRAARNRLTPVFAAMRTKGETSSASCSETISMCGFERRPQSMMRFRASGSYDAQLRQSCTYLPTLTQRRCSSASKAPVRKAATATVMAPTV